jgi:pre-peptidase/Big-like domain-containing protein
MTHRNVIRLFSGTLIGALVLGCGSDNHPTDTGPFLEVTPLFSGLLEGSTEQVTATMDGAAVPVTWSSNNTAVITVSATGLVTAVGAGNAAATATLTSDPTKKRSASFTVVSPPTLTSGVPVTGLASSAARGTTRLWKIVVPAGKTSLTVTLAGGTGDVDLYIKQGTPPTFTSYACASENGGNNETCTITNPTAGTWFVMLGLWDAYTGVTLTATVAP